MAVITGLVSACGWQKMAHTDRRRSHIVRLFEDAVWPVRNGRSGRLVNDIETTVASLCAFVGESDRLMWSACSVVSEL